MNINSCMIIFTLYIHIIHFTLDSTLRNMYIRMQVVSVYKFVMYFTTAMLCAYSNVVLRTLKRIILRIQIIVHNIENIFGIALLDITM